MELTARVIQGLGITSGVSKAGNPWQKGELVVETEGQYPKKIMLSNMKSAEEFARLPIGSLVKFGIDLESREYNGKWYTNVNAFSFQLMEGQLTPPQQQNAPSQQPYAPSPQSSGYQQPPQGHTQGYQQPLQQSDEDLPF